MEKSNILIILDLDETLIHASLTELDALYSFKVDEYFIYIRPLLHTFLTNLSHHFAIGIWSSASDEYVQEITRQILPDTLEPILIWGRSKCTVKRDVNYDTYNFEKRLDKLKKKGYSLEQILIIDDSPSKSRTNYGNAIYIKEFLGDMNDQELQFLYEYLLTFKKVTNVRVIEKRGWRNNKV